jgi:excisionase family DNA binding protein
MEKEAGLVDFRRPMDREPTRFAGRSSGGLEWLTLGQAAKYLGVAQSTIRKWSDSGRLPAFYTPGGHRRFRRSDLEAFVGGSRGSAPPAAGRRQGLILVVDDDPKLREFVRVNLEMEGYSVREAGSAEEGLAALEEEPPDLILLDVMMPEVSGWEMLSRMQEKHGVGAIPVIMFSGKVDETTAAASERGAQAFIGKPFDPQQLIESARQLLRV